MTSVALYSRALGIAVAAFLVGCGAAQVGAPTAMTTNGAPAATHKKSGTTGDLVYATGPCGGVCIFSYPDGVLENTIGLSVPVGGVCSDSAGNVFVTNNAQVLEYAHGGTTPIATLVLPGVNAAACGVDPRTGNLAVTFGSSAGNVAVFAKATGTPKVYDAGQGAEYCGYDKHGNLFVSGYLTGVSALAELPHGGSAFIAISLPNEAGGPGQVQWDGKHITLESRGRTNVAIARLSISGSSASVLGKTMLKGPKWASQSWIAGNRVITPYTAHGNVTNQIGIWRYPKGGKILLKFPDFGQTANTIVFGVTVSRG